MKKRRNRLWLRRFCALALAAALAVPVRVIATTIDEVQQRQEELAQENQDLQSKIDGLKEDEGAALAYQEELTGKIGEAERQIDDARATIDQMNEKITQLESKLELSKQEYQQTIDLFSQRLRAVYVSGGRSVGTLEILLNSSSLSDFFLKQRLIEVTAQHDQALLDQLNQYMEDTEQDRKELAEARNQVAESKKTMESAQEELELLYAENDALVASLESQQVDAQNQIAQNEAEDAQLQAQLQALIEARNREEQERREQEALQNSAVSEEPGGEDEDSQDDSQPDGVDVEPITPGLQSGFSPMWPLPGVGVGSISGHFGDMYFNGPHNGLDIAAGYGTPIVAAQAGEVIQAEYHWSWGNNVLIWHNETFATRYAHCSSLAVSPGQYVEQGQIIGYVGSTGESFGNHLHFEVYYNGVRVNPDPYLGI